MNKTKRIEKEAKYLLRHKCTIRECAKHFNLSKSTIHVDLSHKLPKLNPKLYVKVKKLLEHNYLVKHIRGGISTAKKYKKAG